MPAVTILRSVSTAQTGPTDIAAGRLLEAARGGDEDAFRRLVEPHRGELQAHGYRMLGSVHDAEDALQDAFLRAWRGLDRLESEDALRAWLYKITTNTCLDTIGKRKKRVLAVDNAPATDPGDGPGDPLVETVWIEPFPDEVLEVEDGYATPEASYEQREAIELAFIAALQHLPANQRAVLILREVLGYSAQETADLLETSVASVNSALQRARKAVEEKAPAESQQQTLRSLGDDQIRELVDTYVEAWENQDVDTVVGMLSEDASFSMPPLASWFGPRDQIAEFLASSPMSGDWKWKAVPTRANGQPALGYYTWSDEAGYYRRFALNILSFDDDGKISDVTAFLTRTTGDDDRERILRLPEHDADPYWMKAAFENFGLPERLD